MRPWQQALIDNPPQLDYVEADLPARGGTTFGGAFGPPSPAPGPVVQPPERYVPPPRVPPRSGPGYPGFVPPPSFADRPVRRGYNPRTNLPMRSWQNPRPGATPQNHYQRLVGQKVLERLFGMQAGATYGEAQQTGMSLQELIEALRMR